MSKSAGIITFHCVPNYGAALQAYALQNKLKEYFDDVTIIDYRPNSIMEEYKCISFYSFPSFAVTLWSAREYLKKKNKFAKFQKKYFNLSEAIKNNETIISFSDSIDAMFVGSDQIWNPQITRGFDPVYFGKIKIKSIRVIASYAASMGKSEFNKEECDEFRRLMGNIDCVSVREKQFQNLLSREFNINSTVVADPTILAGKDAFINMIHPVPYDDYVLCYSLSGMQEIEALAEKIARYKDSNLIEISGQRKAFIKKNHKVIYDAGPEDFISLISKASYIVTDSFHGTVFSLLFHVPFNSVINPERGGRLVNLLETVGMENRMTTNFNREDIITDINWDNIDNNLSTLRFLSEEYIRQVMESIDDRII